MELIILSWRNLWRNRRRTLITLAAISLGIMLLQGFHNLSFGVYATMVESGVRSGSGHLTLYPKGYASSRDEKLRFDPGNLPQAIAADPRVEAIVPRIYLPGLAQSSRESRGIIIIGVDPAKEIAVNPFLRTLDADEMLRPEVGQDALVGSRLLKELQIKPGGKFVITVQNDAGELTSELFRVRGVLKTGVKTVDASLVMINLDRAARISGRPGEIHELALMLRSPRDIPAVQAAVAPLISDPAIVLLSWEEAMANLANAIKLDYSAQKFIFLIIILIVGIGVVNTMLMAVMERYREFGTILALGATPARLRLLVLLEAFWLGLVAVVVGLILGSLLTHYLATEGIDIRNFVSETLEFGGVVFEPILRATWDIGWMLMICLGALIATILAACYPAWRAGRAVPADAMRHH